MNKVLIEVFWVCVNCHKCIHFNYLTNVNEADSMIIDISQYISRSGVNKRFLQIKYFKTLNCFKSQCPRVLINKL